MKIRSMTDKILLTGICVAHVSIMGFFVHMLTPCDIRLPSIPIAHYQAAQTLNNQIGKETPQAPEADTGFLTLAEPEADLEKHIGADIIVFDYDPEFLASIRGKDAEIIFHPLIIKVANEHEIDPALIKSIIWAESSFNPRAVSEKGAVGLMQLMPSTAESLGVEDSLNPESNIDGGVRYFKKLLEKFNGDPKLALAAYNAGSRKVLQYKGVPPFEATQYYIKKVFKYYEGYKKFETNEVDQI